MMMVFNVRFMGDLQKPSRDLNPGDASCDPQEQGSTRLVFHAPPRRPGWLTAVT